MIDVKALREDAEAQSRSKPASAYGEQILTLLDALDLAREALKDIIVWLPEASVSGHLLKVEIDIGIAKDALERIDKMMGDGNGKF